MQMLVIMSSSPTITECSDAGMYMDRLDEWVQDEGKIVTYKWLSRTLSLSVTSAKQILSSYVEKCKEKTDPDEAAVHVFYTLTGQDKDTSGIMVLLVDEEDREKYESQLQTVYNVAVYSVQKSKPKDTAALYNSDRQCMLDHLSSYSQWNLIECPNMTTRSIPINNTIPTTTTIEAADHSTSSVRPFASKPTKRKPINKDSVTSFFGKAQKQQTSISQSSSNEKENSPITRKKESVTSSIKRSGDTTLQAKPSNGPPSTIKKELVEEEALLDKEQDNSTSVQGPIESEDIRMVKKEGKNEESEEPKAKRKPTKKASDPKPKATQLKKKRRRIQNMSSDECDSEPEQQQISQKSLPATSSTIKSTDSSSPASSATKKRKRVKKLVTKMFVEEDGSMVTEKHWEEVSTDASDEEKPTLPPSPMVAGSKMAATSASSSTGKKKKGTQASLMSFFGK